MRRLDSASGSEKRVSHTAPYGIQEPGFHRRYNRRCMRRWFFLLLACAALPAQQRPFDANAMMALKRIGDPQVSPDGRLVAFQCRPSTFRQQQDHADLDRDRSEGRARRGRSRRRQDNERPRWSPDSRRIAFVSDRGGSSQIWLMDPDGANAKQVTNSCHRGRWRAVFAGRQEPGIHQRCIPNAAPMTPATRRISTPRRAAR